MSSRPPGLTPTHTISALLGLCNATIDDASCFVMGADIVYILNGNRNTDYSAYLAYLALNDQMGGYDAELPDVARVLYLNPTPVLPPVAVGDPDPSADEFISSGNDTISNSPWIVGAAVAMITTGLLTMMVWKRNRRNQDRYMRQLELDDVSDTGAPENSPRESAQVVSHPL